MARMKDFYKEEVAPALMKKFGYKSVMQIPKLDKIVINVGAGEAKENAKAIDSISGDLAKITGQKPVVCKAKKSVANFKLREGMPIGVKVTPAGRPHVRVPGPPVQRGLPVCATSAALTPTALTGAATTTWASASS